MSKIQIKILNPVVDFPSKATEGSAGFDLQAAIDKTIVLMPGESKLIPTGLAIHINKKEYVAFILPRSKKGAKEGIVTGNLTGVIDSDYQGEWFISCWNRNFDTPIEINPLDKIAQVTFLKLADISFQLVDEFDSTTTRSDGGISKDRDTYIPTVEVKDHCEASCTECSSNTFIYYYSTRTKQCADCGDLTTINGNVDIRHQRG